MTQFELETDCQTQLADARVKIETLQMHKATLAKRNTDLLERNAFLLASAEAAQANLAACRRELAEARATISANNKLLHDAGADFDRMMRERDEARAEIATLTLKLANARLNLKHCSEEVDKRDECAGQLAEARAEVERLRPAAEAWEAHEAHLYADKHARTYAETSEARANYVAAAARARAAKEAKL
jgi:chromosome segregation ATPase